MLWEGLKEGHVDEDGFAERRNSFRLEVQGNKFSCFLVDRPVLDPVGRRDSLKPFDPRAAMISVRITPGSDRMNLILASSGHCRSLFTTYAVNLASAARGDALGCRRGHLAACFSRLSGVTCCFQQVGLGVTDITPGRCPRCPATVASGGHDEYGESTSVGSSRGQQRS